MKLSIITINYNNANGLEKTIVSVMSQTHRKEIEYIVIDGASTDGSVGILERYSDQIDIVVSEKDSGIYNAMNKGVRRASGDYLLFLNSGDTLYAEEVLNNCLPQLGEEDIIIGQLSFMDGSGLAATPGQLSLLFFYDRSLPHPATFIKRELLIKRPYDESLRIASDWKFFMQSIVLENATYKTIVTIVSSFDCNGISSKNRTLCKVEKDKVLLELIPERILCDYTHFLNGNGYEETAYDRFYIRLRETRYGALFYKMNKRLLRFFSLFKSSARAFDDVN